MQFIDLLDRIVASIIYQTFFYTFTTYKKSGQFNLTCWVYWFDNSHATVKIFYRRYNHSITHAIHIHFLLYLQLLISMSTTKSFLAFSILCIMTTESSKICKEECSQELPSASLQ